MINTVILDIGNVLSFDYITYLKKGISGSLMEDFAGYG